jgi:hypothetical protein
MRELMIVTRGGAGSIWSIRRCGVTRCLGHDTPATNLHRTLNVPITFPGPHPAPPLPRYTIAWLLMVTPVPLLPLVESALRRRLRRRDPVSVSILLNGPR